jgi:putative transposase
VVYHVLNRANARMTLFAVPEDYELMLLVFAEAHQRSPMRTLGYCIMPNHWHLLLWPRGDGDLPEFMRWLTVTHTQRWHASHGTAGTGHLYQGRYKSFPVQQTRPSRHQRSQGMLEGGDAVLSVLRYVERNPLRAGLVTVAEAWLHSSLHARMTDRGSREIALTEPPGGLTEDWASLVNQPQSPKELEALRRCIQRGCPLGREEWVKQVARQWGLDSTLRPRGRPRKVEKGS